MCRAVRCSTCGKTSWAGCGQHVDQVMAGVPDDRRCPGHDEPTTTERRGLLARVLGGR